MIYGTFGEYRWHLRHQTDILSADKVRAECAMSLVLLEKALLFVADTNVHIEPNTDAAVATRNILKPVTDGIEVCPISVGMGNRAHTATPSITVRGRLNLAGTSVESYS